MHAASPAPWWRTAVAYQIYVRSFADANGDGVGDLPGIIAKLDHLQRLGVDAIWLNPCYPSPQHDHGYDVADYLAIHHEYGDLADFDRLITAARDHGIRVLMDIVPNHSSHEHAWFRRALASPPGSEARDWYWFRDGRGPDGSEPPNNWRAWFGGPAWTRVTEADGSPGQWYLHLFTPFQPDVNWNHEPLRAAFDDVLRFWFDRGVEGFRIDAPALVGKADGLPDAPPPLPGTPDTGIGAQNPHVWHRIEVHQMFERWRRCADDYERAHPGRSLVFIGETYAPSFDIVASYVSERELQTTFDFSLLLANWEGHRWVRAIEQSVAHPDTVLTWTMNNHDAQRSVTRYGHADAREPSSFTDNNLINSHAPVDLAVGTVRARAAAWVLAFLPSPVFLYQGEELGLEEVLDLPDDRLQDPIFFRTGGKERGRDGCRVPMPWTGDAASNYGFSLVADATPSWLPMPATYGAKAADAQRDDPASVLSSYRYAFSLRRLVAQRTQAADALAVIPVDALDGRVDVLRLRRGDVECWTNFGEVPVALPDGVEVIAHSLAPLPAGGAPDALATDPSQRTVAPDTTAWCLRTH